MACFVPQILGVGYKYVGDVLNGGMALKLMLLLLVLKLFAVTISYASGNAGGIFGPSLFLGAMLGGIVGTLAHHVAPGYVATPGAYALVGMGTAFAGIVRAPMTSVLMIFEITRDYAVIVPLMISNLVSFFISSRFQREPIYEVLAHQDGIHLPTAGSRIQESQRQVYQAMHAATEVLDAHATIQEALNKVSTSRLHAWPVVDESGVIGMVSLSRLQRALTEGATPATAKRDSGSGRISPCAYGPFSGYGARSHGCQPTRRAAGSQSRQRAQARRNCDSAGCLEALRRGAKETTVASGEPATTPPQHLIRCAKCGSKLRST